MVLALTQCFMSERPGHHERELGSPERAAVRSMPFGHHEFRPRIASAHRVAVS
jgi:hypothetical protein